MGNRNPTKPNIICFVTDQQRADHLGCYGNVEIKTPNIDRLAREGVTFTQSFVANPVCMPNRASMFTGRYPKAHRVRENGIALSPADRVLPEVLRRAGYQTASFGKIHLTPFAIVRGEETLDYECYESFQYWQDHDDLPTPYYGLEQVYLVDGHGPYVYGHYKHWLQRKHPGTYEKLHRDRALVPPTGTRESWKAAIPEELHYNTIIADKTIEFLKTRDESRRFFVWCSFPDPHHPYSPPRPWCDFYDPRTIRFSPARREAELDDLPPYFRDCYEGKIVTGGLEGDLRKTTDDHYREIAAHTYGMISMVDHNIGKVMGALEELSLLDTTIVVFFSDHGDLMGDHWLINKGPFLYRGLVRVPTIWRLPDEPRAGTASPALISAVDFAPTLFDLADVPIPDGVQGRSYGSVLNGQRETLRDCVYIEYDETCLKDRLRQIRSNEWAITYYANNGYGLLFDLREDPNELDNLWNDKGYEKVKHELLAGLLRQTSVADDWLPPKKCHA